MSATGAALDFRFADFEIDIARHELRRAGAIVHIEPQVFDLLVHLVRNRDRIVKRPCRRQYGLCGPGGSGALSRGTPQGWPEELA